MDDLKLEKQKQLTTIQTLLKSKQMVFFDVTQNINYICPTFQIRTFFCY